jgi:glutaredoxin
VTVQLKLTMISRSGCHLCDVAEDALARVVGRFSAEHPKVGYEIERLDVDQDQELLEKYSDEVPVLLLNGRQLAFLRIEEDRVFEAMEVLL